MFMFLLKCRIDYKNGVLGKTLIELDNKIKSQPYIQPILLQGSHMWM